MEIISQYNWTSEAKGAELLARTNVELRLRGPISSQKAPLTGT